MSESEQSNGVRFINAFNRVDAFLKKEQPNRTRDTFGVRVDKTKKLTDADKPTVKLYADLRNAISHTPGSHPVDPIAEPRIEIVEDFERIADYLEKPPLVAEELKQPKVEVLKEADDVAEFLTQVRDADFSQAPVKMADGSLKLITTNAVARWLANEYQTGQGAVFEHITLGEVITRYAESGDKIRLGSRRTTVVQAWRIFAGLDGNVPPHALVITENGKSSEKPLAIVTRSDLPALMKALE